MNLAADHAPANWTLVGPGTGLMILAGLIVMSGGWYFAVKAYKDDRIIDGVVVMGILTIAIIFFTGLALTLSGNAG